MFQLQTDCKFGRYLVAKRTINLCDIIIQEEPLILGPKFSNSDPVCVKCLQGLKRSPCTVESLCEKCLWPVCGTECVTLIDSNSHDEECKILVNGADKIAKTNYYLYDALTPLKCILLQLIDKNKWNQLMELQSHIESRGPDSEVYEYVTHKMNDQITSFCNDIYYGYWYYFREINSISKYLKNNYLSKVDFEASSDLIHRVCGILDVNAVVVQTVGTELIGIYPTVSILEHDCLSNTNLSFNKHGHICVNAARKIVK